MNWSELYQKLDLSILFVMSDTSNQSRATTSSHLHAMSSIKLSLTVNWESSKNLILLNSASFFKNLTHFNMSIMLCKAELTCWHHIAICTLFSVKQSWLADIILLFVLCKAEFCWHHTADLLASYCHLTPCSAHWHRTAISCSAPCQAELTRWHRTATPRALLRLLAPYCQISMFHSWTSCEEIQEDQLCWSNAQIYRDQMSKKKKRHRLSIKLIIAQSWKHIKMKYDEILNFTFQCDASINFCWSLPCLP